MKQHESKYITLANLLKEEIRTGKLKYGSRMYSENQLCEMHDVSRQTVRNAMKVLTEEGLIETVRGSGTYVGKYSNVERKKYKSIAVVSTHVDSYIFPETIQGMVKALTDAGYTAQIAFTNNRVDEERKILKTLLMRDDIDGLIVEATKSALPNPNLDYYRELQNRRIPMLFFNAAYTELNAPVISLDDTQIAYKATSYLISMGHKKIAGIFKADDGQGRYRYTGYLNALIDAGISIDDRKVLWIDTINQKSMSNMKDAILNRLSGCTAVFCYNDQVACSVISILENEGYKVPKQMSVMGIDASEMSVLSNPQITSIPHPRASLGKLCAEHILKMIDNPGFNAGHLYCPDVVEHDSVRKIGGYD